MGELTRCVMRIGGAKEEHIQELVPYARVPGLSRVEAEEEEAPPPTVDPNSQAGRMLAAQARREAAG